MNKEADISIFTLRHFWKKRIVIETLILILILTFSYLTYKYLDENDNYFSIFLSLSSGLIVVWLTVRFVDGLLEKRKYLYEIRNNFISNVDKLISCFEFNLEESNFIISQKLKRQLSTFRIEFNDKKYYLNSTESDKINRILIELSLIETEYFNFAHRTKDFKNPEFKFEKGQFIEKMNDTTKRITEKLKIVQIIQEELINEANQRTNIRKK